NRVGSDHGKGHNNNKSRSKTMRTEDTNKQKKGHVITFFEHNDAVKFPHQRNKKSLPRIRRVIKEERRIMQKRSKKKIPRKNASNNCPCQKRTDIILRIFSKLALEDKKGGNCQRYIK